MHYCYRSIILFFRPAVSYGCSQLPRGSETLVVAQPRLAFPRRATRTYLTFPSAQVAASPTHSKDEKLWRPNTTMQWPIDHNLQRELDWILEGERESLGPMAIQQLAAHAVQCIRTRNQGNQLARTKVETHVLPSSWNKSTLILMLLCSKLTFFK
jgi:hypothetical protein